MIDLHLLLVYSPIYLRVKYLTTRKHWQICCITTKYILFILYLMLICQPHHLQPPSSWQETNLWKMEDWSLSPLFLSGVDHLYLELEALFWGSHYSMWGITEYQIRKRHYFHEVPFIQFWIIKSFHVLVDILGQGCV